MSREHLCDERCDCPRCGKHCYYSPTHDQHACVDPECAWTDKPGPGGTVTIVSTPAGRIWFQDAYNRVAEDSYVSSDEATMYFERREVPDDMTRRTWAAALRRARRLLRVFH